LPGALVLCFDDNTRGIFDHAYPRLARRGWPFVVGAHTAYVGVRTGKDHNTWAQLRQMEQRGRARVVSQTHTHPEDLRTLSEAALAREMTESRRRMDGQMGRQTRFVIYPSGHWDRRVAVAASAAGYRLGLTEDRGPAETSPHLLGLRRYSSHRRFDEALGVIARAAGKG
jgi:peptidoglycan/xylan/chitin deacetylase (PgdA/CDA1 family)